MELIKWFHLLFYDVHPRFYKYNMERVFISGPMTGLSREEYTRRFNDAEAMLKEAGYKVVNPVNFLICNHPRLFGFVSYRLGLLYDLLWLSTCDYIYMLDGWQDSNGSSTEEFFASRTGIKRLEITQ